MKGITRCTRLVVVLVGVAALVLAGPAWAVVGTGTLTVDNNTTACPGASGFSDFDTPNHWDVFQNQTVHINISPAFTTCAAGPNLDHQCSTDTSCSASGTCNSTTPRCAGGTCNSQSANTGASCTISTQCQPIKTCSHTSPVNPDGTCTTNADCSFTASAGTCASRLECSGDTTVIVKGKSNTPCTVATEATDCTGTNETGECDADAGLCKIHVTIATSGRTGSGPIDVCYNTDDSCSTATVAYCGDVGLLANRNHPPSSSVYIAADLRTVDANDVPISTSEACGFENLPKDCTTDVGSFCCGLTQGAYGATNSTATAFPAGSVYGTTCPLGSGFIELAACAGNDPFAQGTPAPDGNATTIGLIGTRAVTLDDLTTLIAYLPASGTPKQFNTTGTIAPVTDTHYSGGSIGGSQNVSGSGSKGNGGGALAGQAMACSLNIFLSSVGQGPTGGQSLTASNFGGLTIPSSLLCTRRSGENKKLGDFGSPDGDDVCQAFSYPTCVQGLTVSLVLQAANEMLANGSSTTASGCTASDLNNALFNIDNQFDQCGWVIDCPTTQTTAGVFTCGSQ